MCTIQPDPDISGIGVRTAIYVQALLPATQFAFIPLLMREGGKRENIDRTNKIYDRCYSTMVTSILMSGAIALASILKLRDGDLSAYDAVVVMTLGIIVTMGGSCSLIMLVAIEEVIPRPPRAKLVLRLAPRPAIANRGPGSPFRTLDVLHTASSLVIFTCQAVLVFSGDRPALPFGTPCADSTVFWLCGRLLRVADPTFRAVLRDIYVAVFVWLFAYCLRVVVTATEIPDSLVRLPMRSMCGYVAHVPVLNALRRRRRARTHLDPVGLTAIGFLYAITIALTIASTEMTITLNNVGPGQTTWGFGQTLSLILVVQPAWGALLTTWDAFGLVRRAGEESKPEHKFDLSLLPTAGV